MDGKIRRSVHLSYSCIDPNLGMSWSTFEMGLEDGEKYSEFVEIGQCADADRHRCADDFGSSL